MDKQKKALQREYRSAVRMMIAARHEAEHGRYKKALWMVHKAREQGMRGNQINTDNVIHEIYGGSTELMWEMKEALVAYSKAVRRERRFLKRRKNK